MEKLCGIYQFRNLANGKVYIGSSQDCKRRYGEHRSRLVRGAHINAKLQSAWTKYGENSFAYELIASVLSKDDLEAVEQIVLDDREAVMRGYNLAPVAGNTSGWKASPETRKRMSEAAKMRDHSVQVEAMRKASTGKRRPQHVIDAMLAGKLATVCTDETRAKMSASAKARGSNITPEHQERLRLISIAKGKFSDQ